jgi:hypothetical protein
MKDESSFNSTWSLLFALSSSHSLYNIIVPCNWFIKLMMPRSDGWVFNMLVLAFISSLILQCLDIAVYFPILLFMLFISIIWISFIDYKEVLDDKYHLIFFSQTSMYPLDGSLSLITNKLQMINTISFSFLGPQCMLFVS